MNLLFTRSQARSMFFSIVPLRIGGTVTFKLKTELELTEEEHMLLKQYSFSNATLISSDTYDDLARSFRPAWLVSLVVMLLSAFFLRLPIGGIEGILINIAIVPLMGILCLITMTVIYFFALRSNITVSQLLNGGRTFYCASVVELDEQEKELLDLSRRLHATLEKAKNWGGREINPIPVGETFYLPNAQFPKQDTAIQKGLYAAGAGIGKMLHSKSSAGQETKTVEVNSAPAIQPTPQPIAPAAQPSPQPAQAHIPNPTQAQPPKTETAAHPLAPKPPTDSA